MADVSDQLTQLRDAVREIEDEKDVSVIAAHAVNAIGNVLLAILYELREANEQQYGKGGRNA